MDVDQADPRGGVYFVCKTSKGKVTSVRENKLSKLKPKQVRGRLKRLRSPPRDLILECPTWCSCPNWAAKTIVPFPEDDQIIIL